MSTAPRIDAARVIADLRELDRRTGGEGGARRVAWGEVWHEAREFLGELADEVGLEPERDAAGNVWIRLRGEVGGALALGSHLDSVPSGGWLDGALGVMAALGVLRAWAQAGARPPRDLLLVDWADEEGARFGHSLLGSSAAAGRIDPEHVRGLHDEGGRPAAEVLAEAGVELERMAEAGGRLEGVGAYLELHIEQGPVLESEGLSAAAVSGCVGIERFLVRFRGQASHAGTTPMKMRRDAGLAAAETALAVERIAVEREGVGTCGQLELAPGIVTAVAGEAELAVDLRHADAAALESMRSSVIEAAREAGEGRRCDLTTEPIWSIEPIAFDPDLVAAARSACSQAGGGDRVLTSGALHDAAVIARVVPAAMIFCPSAAGLSHTREEDTPEGDLITAVEAFGALAATCCQGM